MYKLKVVIAISGLLVSSTASFGQSGAISYNPTGSIILQQQSLQSQLSYQSMQTQTNDAVRQLELQTELSNQRNLSMMGVR